MILRNVLSQFFIVKCIKKVENWLPRYSRGRTDDLGCYAAWISIVCNNNIYSLVWLGTEGENPAIFSCTGSRVSLEERINRTWKVLTDIRFMTLAWSYAKQAARSPKWYIWWWHDICSTVDVFKISSCPYIMFVSWFLCVFYSMTFVLRNTDPTQREGICSFADIKKKQLKFMLNFALFC